MFDCRTEFGSVSHVARRIGQAMVTSREYDWTQRYVNPEARTTEQQPTEKRPRRGGQDKLQSRSNNKVCA